MRSFLLVYDRARGTLLEAVEYGAGERTRALRDRFRKELEVRGRDVEVVLLSAASLDALRKTHGRYFKTPSELVAGLGA